MEAEEKSKRLNKQLHIIELKLIKILPPLLAFIYFCNTLLSIFKIDIVVLSYIGGFSLIPLIFMYVTSYAFKFCEYHRMFLHYIVVNNIISLYDYYYLIPLDVLWFTALHVSIFCIFLFVILYLYLKSRRNEKFNRPDS